jgi:hypothetical protein
VKICSRGTPEFWGLYEALPAAIKSVARKNYQLWVQNPFHPSLHFKPLHKPNWCIRVGNHYRAVGIFVGDDFFPPYGGWSVDSQAFIPKTAFEKGRFVRRD